MSWVLVANDSAAWAWVVAWVVADDSVTWVILAVNDSLAWVVADDDAAWVVADGSGATCGIQFVFRF